MLACLSFNLPTYFSSCLTTCLFLSSCVSVCLYVSLSTYPCHFPIYLPFQEVNFGPSLHPASTKTKNHAVPVEGYLSCPGAQHMMGGKLKNPPALWLGAAFLWWSDWLTFFYFYMCPINRTAHAPTLLIRHALRNTFCLRNIWSLISECVWNLVACMVTVCL